MQLRGLVGCIKCGGSHHPFSHVRANPFPEALSLPIWPPLVTCHRRGFTIRGCDLFSTIMAPLAMGITRGAITFSKFLYPTKSIYECYIYTYLNQPFISYIQSNYRIILRNIHKSCLILIRVHTSSSPPLTNQIYIYIYIYINLNLVFCRSLLLFSFFTHWRRYNQSTWTNSLDQIVASK